MPGWPLQISFPLYSKPDTISTVSVRAKGRSNMASVPEILLQGESTTGSSDASAKVSPWLCFVKIQARGRAWGPVQVQTRLWERPSVSLETAGIPCHLTPHLWGWRRDGTWAGEGNLESQRAWLLMRSRFTPRGVTTGTHITCLDACALETIPTFPSRVVGRRDGVTPSLRPYTLSFPPCRARE